MAIRPLAPPSSAVVVDACLATEINWTPLVIISTAHPAQRRTLVQTYHRRMMLVSCVLKEPTHLKKSQICAQGVRLESLARIMRQRVSLTVRIVTLDSTWRLQKDLRTAMTALLVISATSRDWKCILAVLPGPFKISLEQIGASLVRQVAIIADMVVLCVIRAPQGIIIQTMGL